MRRFAVAVVACFVVAQLATPSPRAEESSKAIRAFISDASEHLPDWRKDCRRDALAKFVDACRAHLRLADELGKRPTVDMADDVRVAREQLTKLRKALGALAPASSINLCTRENVDIEGCLADLGISLVTLNARIRALSKKQ